MARWRAIRKVRRWLIAECTRLLTKPLASYVQRVPNNIDNLKRTLRKGDVLLVEGDQRVSQVIRYLTQSCWSHSAIYVGDELLKGDAPRAAELRARFGDEAQHLLIEADVGHGVCATPLSKYQRYNIRICRPQGLHRDDVSRVLEFVVGHLGRRYDVRHLVELARFFFPVSIVPRRWRRAALTFGSCNGRAVICSSMIADAFTRVGYPILPEVTLAAGAAVPERWWKVLRRSAPRPAATFRRYNTALVTPRDFDLSPYFEVVKFNHFGDPRFNYREIVWDDEPAAAPAGNGTAAAARAASSNGGSSHAPVPLPRLRGALGGAWSLIAGVSRR